MAGKFLAHLRGQWIGVVALLLVLTGGTAYALNGSNTVFSDDIVNGDVKVTDIGQAAVATDEIANNQVKAADIGDGEVMAAEIANGQVGNAEIATASVRTSNVADNNLTGGDIAGNSLKGADIDEGTLDVGDAARAYAYVNRADCAGETGPCNPTESKGISSVTRTSVGQYCVIAPGIDSADVPAAVTVDWAVTNSPEGNASAFTVEQTGCGAGATGFLVYTYHGDQVAVTDTGGNPAVVNGSSGFDNHVSFTIVIP